jgi:hypothetical protein
MVDWLALWLSSACLRASFHFDDQLCRGERLMAIRPPNGLPRLLPPSAGFTVSARTILELGSELISTDSIALYELIKNAYDAGSKRAVVRVTNLFRHSSLRDQLDRIAAARASLAAAKERDPYDGTKETPESVSYDEEPL